MGNVGLFDSMVGFESWALICLEARVLVLLVDLERRALVRFDQDGDMVSTWNVRDQAIGVVNSQPQ